MEYHKAVRCEVGPLLPNSGASRQTLVYVDTRLKIVVALEQESRILPIQHRSFLETISDHWDT